MDDLTERLERQPVVHHVFDDGCVVVFVESVGVNPEVIGTAQLLVYEPEGRPPVRDARPPKQRISNKLSL
jgi:hypothetical protein